MCPAFLEVFVSNLEMMCKRWLELEEVLATVNTLMSMFDEEVPSFFKNLGLMMLLHKNKFFNCDNLKLLKL